MVVKFIWRIASCLRTSNPWTFKLKFDPPIIVLRGERTWCVALDLRWCFWRLVLDNSAHNCCSRSFPLKRSMDFDALAASCFRKKERQTSFRTPCRNHATMAFGVCWHTGMPWLFIPICVGRIIHDFLFVVRCDSTQSMHDWAFYHLHFWH